MTAFSSLITVQSLSQILARGLEIAVGLGLPVTSWRAGDPTRSLYHFLAEILSARESYTSEFVKSAVLSTASGDWLTVVASEVYGVDRVEATYATSTVTLTNSGGGYYTIEAGDVTVRNTISGATYHNTTGGVLAGGTSLALEFTADDSGSDFSSGANEIDALVTTLLGVTATASTLAVGQDEQDDESLREQCRSTLGALSPDGPPDAYEYVARNPTLTGTSVVTRAASTDNSSTGVVTVYVASASGTVSAPNVALVQAAIDSWATPLCITATVVSATATSVAVTASVTGEDIPAGYASDAAAALAALFAGLDIGGAVSRSAVITCLHALAVEQGATNVSVTLTAPAVDTAIAASAVAILGATSITVTT